MNEKDKAIYKLSSETNALNNKTRLALMGLLYFKKLTFKQIVKEVNIDEDKIVYHLNVLLNTEFIEKNRKKYRNTKRGIRILKDIGFLKEIKSIRIWMGKTHPKWSWRNMVNKEEYQEMESKVMLLRSENQKLRFALKDIKTKNNEIETVIRDAMLEG